MRKALILGGGRLTGPALIDRLLRGGYRVIVFNRQTRVPVVRGDVEYVRGDRNDPEALAAVAANRPDVVFDTCCYDDKHAQAAVAAFAGVTRYVFTSTISVYERPRAFPLVESARLGAWPLWGTYAMNKIDAERRFLEAREGGFRTTIVRPTYVLGPGNHVEREAFFVARLLRRVPVVVPGDARALLHFVLADELADAMVRLAESSEAEGQAFNVASNEAVTIEELVRCLARGLQVDPILHHADERRWELDVEPWDATRATPFANSHVVVSNEKLRICVGDVFRPLPERLEELARSYAVQRPPLKPRPIEQEILAAAGFTNEAIS